MSKEILYRNETAFGSGVVKAKDIIMFEIIELCNTDILDYCMEQYEDVLSEDLYERLNTLSYDMSDGAEIDEDAIEELVDDLLEELSEHFEVEIKYAMWLASKEAVIELYSDGNEDAVLTAYETSEIILSDLGYDGKLFGYSKRPKAVR